MFKTKSGKRILNIKIVRYLENGDRTKYPFRGQVVIRETPQVRIKNLMWDINGKTFYERDTVLDLDRETVTEILKGENNGV